MLEVNQKEKQTHKFILQAMLPSGGADTKHPNSQYFNEWAVHVELSSVLSL